MISLRNRLALLFTALTALVLVLLSVAVYFFSERYTRREFGRRLRERAVVAAQTYLEKDELNAQIYQQIREQYLQTLPQEEELVYDRQRRPRLTTDRQPWPFGDDLFERLRREEEVLFWWNRKQVYGLPYADNQGDFVVLVAARDEMGEAKLTNLQRVLGAGFVASVALVYLLGWAFANHTLQPIKRIVSKVNRISASRLHIRLDEGRRRDELSELAATFNRMLDRLRLSFDVQRMFISNASHELRNPLTAILGEIEVTLSRPRTAQEYTRALRKLAAEADKLQQLTTSLLSLAHTDFESTDPHGEAVRLDELLWDVQAEVQRQHPERRVVVNLHHLPENPAQLLVRLNGRLLRIAVLNLVDNACKFSPDQTAQVELYVTPEALQLEVNDRGIGIPPEELERVLEPFYRSHNARAYRGFGIGLSLVRNITHLAGGQLKLTSEPGKGTTAQLRFPLI